MASVVLPDICRSGGALIIKRKRSDVVWSGYYPSVIEKDRPSGISALYLML